jgi:hypothetical protein
MPRDIDSEKHSLLRSDWRQDLKEGIGTSETDRKYRQYIRERVQTGFYDIALLNQYMREDDIKQIFHRENDSNAADPNQEMDERETMMKEHWVPARHMVALAWRGLRLNGMDKKDIFERIIVRGIEDGEADYVDVPHGRVESDLTLSKLEPVRLDENLDPIEKVEKGISLSGEDIQEIHNRLSDHPDVDSTLGENLVDLAKEHLVND